MSKGSTQMKTRYNLYALMDAEMHRMHELLKIYLSMPREHHGHYTAHSSNQQIQASQIGVIWKRILEMQDIILASVKNHEPIIQDKIAELALTGDSD